MTEYDLIETPSRTTDGSPVVRIRGECVEGGPHCLMNHPDVIAEFSQQVPAESGNKLIFDILLRKRWVDA